MSDDLKGKILIKNMEEFRRHKNLHKGNFWNCAFLFPFSGHNSILLIKALIDNPHGFDGAVFSENIKFKETSIDENIFFLFLTFKKSLVFDSIKFSGNLEAHGCTFHDLEFLSSPINELTLLENTFLRKLKVSQNDLQQLSSKEIWGKIDKTKIEKLVFQDNKVAKEGLVRFGYLNVENFHFDNMNNPINSEINIGECDFNNFIIRNVRNKGKFRIYKINTKKTESQCEIFELTDSSLGDSEFQNVNLASYTAVVINDNLLSGLQYTGVKWPDNILVRKMDTDTDRDICAKERDTYRILKNVAQKNNDAPQAIAFYAKEMEAYSRTLSWSWSGPLSWPRERAQMIDKSILLFNKYTNAFGLSWWLPIILILDVGLVLYALLLWSSFCTDNFDKAVGQFFVFLNPTHKTKFICGENWQPFTYFFDFTFRLIEATLIYQTIIAFRKFTRKL